MDKINILNTTSLEIVSTVEKKEILSLDVLNNQIAMIDRQIYDLNEQKYILLDKVALFDAPEVKAFRDLKVTI